MKRKTQVIVRTYVKVNWGEEDLAVQSLKEDGFKIVNFNHREDCIVITGELIEKEEDYIEWKKS